MARPQFVPLVPAHVSFVALSLSDGDKNEIHADEELLLGTGASTKREQEFRLGRVAAKLAIDQLGIDPAPVLRGPHREPLWQPGLVGSITHAGETAMVAVAKESDCGGIGIDLEYQNRYFPGLAAEIADVEERGYLDHLPPADREIATMELFSAKETIYKAFFPRVGSYFGFDAAHVELEPGTSPLTGWLVGALDERYPSRRHLQIHRMWSGEYLLTWLILPPDDR